MVLVIVFAYYHLVTVSCDPRGDRRKAMVKHEIDMPEELLENLEFERHEIIYGKKKNQVLEKGFVFLLTRMILKSWPRSTFMKN